MGQADSKSSFHRLGRFLGFVLPHWKTILLAIAATMLYAGIMAAGVLMLKPIMEGVTGLARGGVAQEEAPAPHAQQDSQRDAAPRSLARTMDRMRDRVTRWFLGIGLVRAVYDYAGPGEDQFEHIAYLTLFVVAPLWSITFFIQTYATGRVTWLVMADVRMELFRKLSHMSLSFFSRRRTGDLISRVTNDVAVTMSTVRLVFSDVMVQPVKLVALLLGSLFVSWRLTLLALVVAPVLVLLLGRIGAQIYKHGRKALRRIGDITESLNQMFSGIRVVKSFNMEEEENAEFRETNRRQLKQAFKLVRSRALASAVPQLMMGLVVGGLLLLGNHMLRDGSIKFTELSVVVAAFFFSIAPIKRSVKSYNTIQANLGAIDRIFELIDQEVDLADAPDAVDIDGVREGMRFRNVWFAYRDDNYVLRDVDLYVPVGKVCAIVGETGAGKSTMLDLIPRFYDPDRGSVEIDGVPVSSIRRQSLMAQIAVVGQHPFLFNRSVAENIRYGRREATDQEVAAAAEAAKLRDVVAGLPEGYDTVVGERGSNLSGGQRQCVTIARALLKDAPILVLDEATSSLDNESERMVQRALAVLMHGRTTFVIAHRLSTVRFADMIVVVKGGLIIEKGSHDQLLELGGEYAKLYKMQFENAANVSPDRAAEGAEANETGAGPTAPESGIIEGSQP